MFLAESGVAVFAVAQKGHKLAEKKCHYSAATTLKTVLAPTEATDGLRMGDNLGMEMLGHPLFQKACMVIMSVGQKEIVDILRLDV